jgi:branched-chain amino acid transport system ATP-binding protein
MPILAAQPEFLALDGICAGYGHLQVLSDISLQVGRGEIVTIVGANGAGKTTLLRVIMGSLVPSRGSVRFLGENLSGAPPHRIAAAGIRLVPEGRRVFPSLTVDENLRAGAYLKSRAVADTALDHVYSLFPMLHERPRQLASTLSGGQQQMLALGRALAAAPQMLMLDEPSLGLAPRIVEEIFEKLAELRGSNNGILLVEQNARKALALADRGYVLENGRIVLAGAARDLRANEMVVSAYFGGGP